MKKENLEAKISERIQLLIQVVDFVTSITEKRGRIIRREIGTCHTRIVRELQDFGGFSFRTDTGQTSFGGNDIKVWYHHGRTDKNDLLPVLSFWWQTGVSEGEVHTFNTQRLWQQALKEVIRRRKQIEKEIHRKKTIAAAEEIAEYEKETHQMKLREMARKLAIK